MENRSSSEASLASSTTEDIDGKSSQDLLRELAVDYSKYLNFDISKENGKFTESVESMLTKLDEFCGLVDMIRSDTTLCLAKTMPEIHAKCQEMQELFDRIDRLEAFVAVVKKDVNMMEGCVSKAEDELSSGSIIKKLSSLVSSKKPSSRPAPKPQFTPPPIFRTEQYLGLSTDTDSSTKSSSGPGAAAPSSASHTESSATAVPSVASAGETATVAE